MSTDAAAAPPLVLLVDDRQDKLIALQAVLGTLNLTLVSADSGKEALRQVLLHEFAVILLDVHMPVMDGFETAALLRRRAATELTPIIFVTGINDTDNHVTRGYSLGAVDYVFTPVPPAVLRAKVSALIDLYRRNRDIQRRSEALRDEAERRAADVGARLGTLLNRLNVGVFRRSLDGRLLDANPAFFRIFGMDPAIDHAAVDLALFGLDVVRDIELLERGGPMLERHLRVRRLDGQDIWISLSKTFAVDGAGRRCLDGLVEDVTRRHEAESVLVAKAEELARSNAELEQFAYIASHDLQEPLRMVSAFSSLLANRHAARLDDQGRHVLAQVIEGATRMQLMVRDILSYSSIDLQAEPAEVDCAAVVGRVLFNLERAVAESAAVVACGAMPVVRGDAALLAQVFQNLIGNALKFRRPEVPPRIAISAERQGSCWWIAVADNGLGIAPQHTRQIFDIFQRLHPRDRYEGTGIGLAVVRKVVERHGGEILVESVEGQGSTFRFSLPAGG